MGGHIDSWDVGQGAMDDGGGFVAAWEALRLMKRLGLAAAHDPRRALDQRGERRPGGGYRDAHRAELADHMFALESDNGVFNPKGYTFAGSDAAAAVIQQVATLLDSAGISGVTRVPESPAADITPLVEKGHPGHGARRRREAGTSGITTATATRSTSSTRRSWRDALPPWR